MERGRLFRPRRTNSHKYRTEGSGKGARRPGVVGGGGGGGGFPLSDYLKREFFPQGSEKAWHRDG